MSNFQAWVHYSSCSDHSNHALKWHGCILVLPCGNSLVRALHMELLVVFPTGCSCKPLPMGGCEVTAMAACLFWAALWTSLLGNSGLLKLNRAATPAAGQFFRGISQAWHYSCPLSRDRTFVSWNRSNQRNSAAEAGRTAWTPSWASATHLHSKAHLLPAWAFPQRAVLS